MTIAPESIDRARPAPPDAAGGQVIRVRGLVQGVGFRPTVWRLARDCRLVGDVRNDSNGVLIHVWGNPAQRARFLRRLQEETPPLARIDSIASEPLAGAAWTDDFRIVSSAGGAVHTAIVADAATCATCLAEIFDPNDRRHRYAFTNCTHCGPRLSIVRRIPYDRAHTSMAEFAMCPRCQAEYDNPADRRFHAQPNACPDCGPRLWLEAAAGVDIDVDGDPVEATQRLLRAGHIVAIKGIGGIHLAVNAGNAGAVTRLRERKQRIDKPFALMARDTDMIRRYCTLDVADTAILRSTVAPIVVLTANGREQLAPGVAPNQNNYGFMLPYTPLHHLLMAALDTPIVLTSGNRCHEPQCIDNNEARQRLGTRDNGIADALLLHDRSILNRLDDSVVRRIAGAPALIRRARGHAPMPLRLPVAFGDAAPVLAFGGELKNTVCLLRDGEAIVSQHLGDLENAAAQAAYRDTLDLYLALFEHRPQVLAVDSHPEYLSSKIGREWSEALGIEPIGVQHHHAHIAACLADNNIGLDAAPVLGIALDGTGYGDDGSIWGGEFLLADYHGYRRLASLTPVPMPGGAQAVRQPWRMAYAHLRRICDWHELTAMHARQPFFEFTARQPLITLDGMIKAGFNCPLTSSCGRLFDAVAAVTGVCTQASYEGQAAIELEAAVDIDALSCHDGYPFAIIEHEGVLQIEPGPMWQALLHDLRAAQTTGVIAARFHTGLAQAVADMVDTLGARHEATRAACIALSGGVFQNAVFSRALIDRLEAGGFEVLRHARVPANDGGLSLGQAVIAAARQIKSPPGQVNNPHDKRTPSCA